MITLLTRLIRASIFGVLTWGSLSVLGAPETTALYIGVLVFLMAIINPLAGIISLPLAFIILWAIAHLLFGVKGLEGNPELNSDQRLEALGEKAEALGEKAEALGEKASEAAEGVLSSVKEVSAKSTLERVRELKAMRDEGLITDAEYERLRDQVILQDAQSAPLSETVD